MDPSDRLYDSIYDEKATCRAPGNLIKGPTREGMSFPKKRDIKEVLDITTIRYSCDEGKLMIAEEKSPRKHNEKQSSVIMKSMSHASASAHDFGFNNPSLVSRQIRRAHKSTQPTKQGYGQIIV